MGQPGDSVEFRYSEGHTPGLLLSVIGGDGGIAFCADLIPGRPWVHLPVTMGYDRFPERLIDEKSVFLEEMLERNIRLFFTHDPEASCARVHKDDQGRYSAVDSDASIAGLNI